MAAVPPVGNSGVAEADLPRWMLIGPGIATVTAMYLVGALYEFGRLAQPMLEFGLLPNAFLLMCVLPYPVAAALTGAFGFLFGGRAPTALALPALGTMILGVALTAFAPGATLVLVGRVLSGLGAGVVVGVTAALVRRAGSARAAATATVVALGVAAVAAAPFINRVAADIFGFRVSYLAAVLFLLAAVIVCAVGGVVRAVSSGRSAPAMPYGTPPGAAPGWVPQPPMGGCPAAQYPGMLPPGGQPSNAQEWHREGRAQ